jgi:hypothetical protein
LLAPFNADVEAVEKVQTEWFRSVNAKIDLSECARFDASTRGKGKRTPENKSIPASRTFSTASTRASPIVKPAKLLFWFLSTMRVQGEGLRLYKRS